MKKFFGYFLLILAVLFTMVAILRIGNIIVSALNVLKIFSAALDSYEIGNALGHFSFWVVYLSITGACWVYGRKWIRKTEIGK